MKGGKYTPGEMDMNEGKCARDYMHPLYAISMNKREDTNESLKHFIQVVIKRKTS